MGILHDIHDVHDIRDVEVLSLEIPLVSDVTATVPSHCTVISRPLPVNTKTEILQMYERFNGIGYFEGNTEFAIRFFEVFTNTQNW